MAFAVYISQTSHKHTNHGHVSSHTPSRRLSSSCRPLRFMHPCMSASNRDNSRTNNKNNNHQNNQNSNNGRNGSFHDGKHLASVDNAALYRDLRARRVALYGSDLVAIQDKEFQLNHSQSSLTPQPAALAGTVSAVVACWILAMYFLLHSEAVVRY